MSDPSQSAKKRDSEPAKRYGFARIEEIGDDGLRLRTLWTPLPPWVIPVAFSLVAGGIALGIASATGSNGDDSVQVAGFAILGAYLGGAIIWAVLGAVGGDRLEVLFDGATETAQVEQRLLWIWGRHWEFEMDDVERIYVWNKRGRFIFRLNETHFAAIGFYNRPPLGIGTYHTDQEVMAAALPLGTFVGVPVRRNERPPARGRDADE
ncbi:MAG: hypothetical protein DK306_001043 [Chloroflexi bacterium]|nr:MAG: hypothetical protein DK306_001043 [Chloroflexota bacterium]